jgi:hypothetical protein
MRIAQPTLHYDTDTPTGCPLLMPAENRQRRHILKKPLGLNIPHVNGMELRHFPSHDVGLSTAFRAGDERQGMVSKRKAEIVSVGRADFPRYIIVADSNAASEHQRYWAGLKWIKQSHLAPLYADRSVAEQDLDSISGRGL